MSATTLPECLINIPTAKFKTKICSLVMVDVWVAAIQYLFLLIYFLRCAVIVLEYWSELDAPGIYTQLVPTLSSPTHSARTKTSAFDFKLAHHPNLTDICAYPPSVYIYSSIYQSTAPYLGPPITWQFMLHPFPSSLSTMTAALKCPIKSIGKYDASN